MGASEQTRGFDALISELAERQHGVAARRQLAELGVGRRAIEARLARKSLYRLFPGVYAVGHRVLSQRGRWMAAVLFAGDGAVLSHRSAAALWEIRSSSGARIYVTTGRKGRSRGPVRRHYSDLPTDEVTVLDGIPVTTVPRTIFDLAAEEPPEAVEAALRESEYRRLYDPLSLYHLLDRYPRRRGARFVRAALARLGENPGRIESALEERLLPFLDHHGLPRPHLNAWLEVDGKRYRTDCLWAASRQIVELDGWKGHGTRTAFRDDRARDRRLRAAGYSVTRIAWSQLDDEPETLAADLRRLLEGDPGATPRAPGR